MEFNIKHAAAKFNDLVKIQFDDMILYADQINEVNTILELKGKTESEVTAIRNGVVKIFEQLMYVHDVDGEVISFSPVHNTYFKALSAITAAIDDFIYKNGWMR